MLLLTQGLLLQPRKTSSPEGPTRGAPRQGPKWVGPRGAQVGGPTWGPSGWAHAGPKWVGPRGAQAGPKWAQVGPKPEIWDPKKIQKIKILKIKIRSAQNVGKVWISLKKNLPAPFGALPGHFLRGPAKSKKCQNFAYFPWWAIMQSGKHTCPPGPFTVL